MCKLIATTYKCGHAAATITSICLERKLYNQQIENTVLAKLTATRPSCISTTATAASRLCQHCNLARSNGKFNRSLVHPLAILPSNFRDSLALVDPRDPWKEWKLAWAEKEVRQDFICQECEIKGGEKYEETREAHAWLCCCRGVIEYEGLYGTGWPLSWYFADKYPGTNGPPFFGDAFTNAQRVQDMEVSKYSYLDGDTVREITKGNKLTLLPPDPLLHIPGINQNPSEEILPPWVIKRAKTVKSLPKNLDSNYLDFLGRCCEARVDIRDPMQ